MTDPATWPLWGRVEALDATNGALHAPGCGVVVTAPVGGGLSRFLAEVASTGGAAGRRVRRLVADGRPGPAHFTTLEPVVGSACDLREACRLVAADDVEVLIVDDAHLMDLRSADLVRTLVLDGSVSVVVGTHGRRPLPEPLAWLRQATPLVEVQLPTLGRQSVAGWLSAGFGGPVCLTTTRRIWHLSAGLPLHLVDLTHTALEHGALACQDGLWRLTGPLVPSVRLWERAEHRLADLDRACRTTIDLLALAEQLTTEQLDGLLRADEAFDPTGARGPDAAADPTGATSPDAAADPADSADPLDPRGWGGAGFATQVIERLEELDLVTVASPPPLPPRIALAEVWMSAARDRTMGHIRKTRLATLLVESAAGGPAQRARWGQLANRPPPDDEVLEAARRARFAGDLDLAGQLAASLADDDPVARHLLAEVLQGQGRATEAADTLLAVVVDESAPASARALATMARSTLAMWNLSRPDEAVELAAALREATRDEPEAGETQAFHGAQLLFAGRIAEAAACVEAVLAEPTPDELDAHHGRALAEAAMVGAATLAVRGDCVDAIAIARRGLTVRRQVGDQLFLAGPEMHTVALVTALVEAGQLDEATVVIDAALDDTDDTTSDAGHGWLALVSVRAALARGDLAVAWICARTAVAAFEQLEQLGPLRWARSGELLAASWAGDRDASARITGRLDELGPSALGFLEPDVHRARAWAAAVAGSVETALGHLAVGIELARTTAQRSLEMTLWHDHVRLGRADGAVGELLGLVDVVQGRLAPTRAAHARALAEGDADALVDVAEAFVVTGATLLGAEAMAQASVVYRRASRARLATTTGRHAAMLQARCPGAATPALAIAATAELSPRERQVAELAAGGRPSRAIADELDISVRTVDNLLHRTYWKLGIAGRTHLADALRGRSTETDHGPDPDSATAATEGPRRTAPHAAPAP